MTTEGDFPDAGRPGGGFRDTGSGREKRGQDRREVNASVSTREPGRKHDVVALRDVSPTGCRISSYKTPRVDDHIWIGLPGLESQRATVKWVAGNECGCAFDRPLHPAVLDALLAKLSA